MHFKKIIFLIIFVLIYQTGFSQEKTAVVFLTTDPINCTVVIDNKKMDHKTPLLLKNIGSGKHYIEIIKKDFIPYNTEINISSEVINTFSYKITPQISSDIIRKGIDYPHQRYIDSLNIVIPVLTGFSAALTYNELSRPHYSNSLLSPFVISTFAVNTVFISTDIALHIHKKSYMEKSVTNKKITGEFSESNSNMVFTNGNTAFQEGRFDYALSNYEIIIDKYKDSPLFPASLYKSALIYMIKENYQEALTGFMAIIENYPAYDLYDKSLKNLAEIYVINEKYDKAVFRLKQMLFADTLYTSSEIEARIEEILMLHKK